ncbi:MAG: GGDEF domain-containing protein [Proteobacteria bacterium]|nr:GGDEF domain-containing protein [Pseudomonadota bacterium]
MSHIIRKIKHDAITLMAILFGIVRKIDYKTLNRYILAINQTNSLESILLETSKCFKEILQYRLFAFVLKDKNNLDAWIDPDIDMGVLETAIRKDFNLKATINVNLINKKEQTGKPVCKYKSEDLVSYELKNDIYTARIYLIPQRKTFYYHREIMGTILKTIRIAVSNYMSIKKLETEAAIDPLTKCVNRREFNRLMKGQIANAKRYKNNLSILMFDIDYFKKINDNHGHQAGDSVLKEIAGAVSAEIRSGDVIARYGGEEFIVILPETKKQKAIELAERLRKIIENKIVISEKKEISVTASFGVSALNSNSDINSIVNEADAMLYKAKANGRNAVMPGLMRLCKNKKDAAQL